ncbi:MAG: tellurium resistance protein TerC [Chloroflexi bacterium RBG_13_56_8b]|nr:MAG: tellurium resistance protein TerC [Chloroflexi bacterium RBG_13_56_8b]
MNETYLWPIFIAIFVLAMVFDLFIFQRKAHIIPLKEALKLVGFWIALALAFNAVIYFYLGHEKGILFTTAYLVEYSLSVDNLFVFLALFTYFAVPREAQRKVLLWGILGAIFFRGIFIFAGIQLLERFHFLIYLLGAFLIYTAIKLMTQKEIEVEPEKNPIVRFARKIIRVAPEYDGAKFFTRTNGLLYATPLIIVLIAIETMDIMFATDSVPAVLAITTDPLIVYASNIFAILGLRALFFALAGLFYIFRYLSTGVCIVLAFVGVKMLLGDVFPIPVLISLGVVIAILAGSVVLSLLLPKKEETPALENPAKKEKGKKSPK